MQRRAFIRSLVATGFAGAAGYANTAGSSQKRISGQVLTVNGSVPAEDLGPALTHEHVLVDFIGAAKIQSGRYDPETAFHAALPHLHAAHARGFRALFECTPQFIGRDPLLLRRLSNASGMRIVTNTGLYGAAGDKFVPAYAYRESAEALARRWIREARHGIGDTAILPGFIKTAVDNAPGLSAIDTKLLEAAARTHGDTGLTIAVHTGRGPGLDMLHVLTRTGAPAEACIWVHAQNAGLEALREAAGRGAWISLDGLREKSAERHLERCLDLKARGHLQQILLSHDAGWFDVVNPERPFRPYTFLIDAFVPLLKKNGFTPKDIEQLLVMNPARAFAV